MGRTSRPNRDRIDRAGTQGIAERADPKDGD
jgi:hypothetical protein